MTPPRPLPGAEKQRRYRERQKRGSISVRVDVPPQAIPALVALGLLFVNWLREETDRHGPTSPLRMSVTPSAMCRIQPGFPR